MSLFSVQYSGSASDFYEVKSMRGTFITSVFVPGQCTKTCCLLFLNSWTTLLHDDSFKKCVVELRTSELLLTCESQLRRRPLGSNIFVLQYLLAIPASFFLHLWYFFRLGDYFWCDGIISYQLWPWCQMAEDSYCQLWRRQLTGIGACTWRVDWVMFDVVRGETLLCLFNTGKKVVYKLWGGQER